MRLCSLLIISLLFVGCSKSVDPATPASVLNKGATITLDYSKSLRLVEDGIRSANTAKVADDATTANVLKLTIKLNQIGLQADNILRSQTTLTVDQKISLKTLLDPMVAAIQGVIDTDVLRISNINTQNNIKAALAAIQLAIKSTLAALGGN